MAMWRKLAAENGYRSESSAMSMAILRRNSAIISSMANIVNNGVTSMWLRQYCHLNS
jgi:hypothetical protein